MDFRLLIRHRLKEMGTEQRDLAAAAKVTESYISQLLTGKKAPPAPERTDIYDKMETFLRLPAGKLAMLADRLRTDALKRKLVDPPAPLFKEVRELILGKCEPGKEQSIRAIFPSTESLSAARPARGGWPTTGPVCSSGAADVLTMTGRWGGARTQ